MFLDHVLSSPENLQHFIEATLDQWTPVGHTQVT